MSKRVLLLRCALLSSVAISVSGCASLDRLKDIGNPPPLSPVSNPTTSPGYKPVQMPMPTPQPATFNPNSLWRNGSRAFFKDQRAHQVGDILTVKVNINDTAPIPGSDPGPAHLDRGFRHHQFHRRQHHRPSGQGHVAGQHHHREYRHAEQRQRHDQPAGSIADQRRGGGDAGAAERQHGDRRQAGSPAEFGNARARRRRRGAPGGHRERQHRSTWPRSPRRASPTAAKARYPTFNSRHGASRR